MTEQEKADEIIEKFGYKALIHVEGIIDSYNPVNKGLQ